MAEIKGFHTLWTAPFFQNNDRDTYDMQDYELLTMILSALMWRKNNGPVTMYGDSRAIDFIGEKGIADIWDGGLKEIHVPGSVPPRGVLGGGETVCIEACGYAFCYGGYGSDRMEKCIRLHRWRRCMRNT